MPYYTVEYDHLVEIKYRAITFADSPEEAMQNIEDGNFIKEDEIDMQGLEIIPKSAILMENGVN